MKINLLKVIAVLFTVNIMWVHSASADELILINNDRLTGTIISLENGILILKTEYSEPVKIKAEKIKKISSEKIVEIHLDSGEVLKGKIREAGEGRLAVERTEGREETTVQWNKVASINPQPVIPPGWKGSIIAGANTQSGNADRLSASLGAKAVRKTDQDRFNLKFLYNYADEDSRVTARNIYGAGKYDYFFTKKMYGYIGTELLSDEFKDLTLRTVVGPGVGYQIWDYPYRSLLVEAGVSYISEDLDTGEDDQWVTARLAGSFMWKIMESITFTDDLIIYPSLDNAGEYQLRNEASLLSPIASGWSLRLSNILERNSDPPAGVKKDDLYWVLGAQYDF